VDHAITVMNRIRDLNPNIIYISRTGKGEMWDTKSSLNFGRQMLKNYVESDDDSFLNLRTNTDLTSTFIIQPAKDQAFRIAMMNKSVKKYPYLSHIFEVPDEAIKVAIETMKV
jgi:hypothetical protein